MLEFTRINYNYIFADIVGNREVPVQDHIDIYYLAREMPASEKTALEAVMEADEERIRLEKLAEQLATLEDDESQDYLMEVSLIPFGSIYTHYIYSKIHEN